MKFSSELVSQDTGETMSDKLNQLKEKLGEVADI